MHYLPMFFATLNDLNPSLKLGRVNDNWSPSITLTPKIDQCS